jgi:glycosyltransferase involved in cell wall biosynthesis
MKKAKVSPLPPRLSVIMTVYNGEAFLRETLDAVMAQTFSDWEMIIVNNGSTDGTQAILDDFDDPRIRIVYPEAHGTFGDGIRLAYSHARGAYIAVQDSDDVSLPMRFEAQVAALDADPKLGLISGGYERIDQDSVKFDEQHPPVTQQELIDAYQTVNPLAHSTYMYRRDASEQIGGYPGEYAYGPDFALAIRLIKKGWGVAILPQVILKLREHGGQTSLAAHLGVIRARESVNLFREALDIPGVSLQARRKGKRNLAKRLLQYSLALMSERQWRAGVGQLILAIVHHPLYSPVYLGYRLLKVAGVRK